jgi:hypothetical protein
MTEEEHFNICREYITLLSTGDKQCPVRNARIKELEEKIFEYAEERSTE